VYSGDVLTSACDNPESDHAAIVSGRTYHFAIQQNLKTDHRVLPHLGRVHAPILPRWDDGGKAISGDGGQ
jgi:hypothetical protein